MKAYRSMVLVSSDPKSIEQGANEVFTRLQEEIKGFGLENEVSLSMVGDVGRSDAVPLVIVYPEAVIYGPVKSDDVHFLVEEHLYKGRVAAGLAAPVRELSGRIAWLSARKGTLPAEKRIVLERAGLIDPDNIEDYVLHNGYEALGKVLSEMTPQQVIEEIKASGLKGRGGAGFPTALKWGFVSKAAGDLKYVICNADESEPGTFKDRLILEGDPHSIIEAMTIAAYAVGATEGYIYVRGEYQLAQARLKTAIHQAEEMGFLGDNIFDSGHSFHLHIHGGAGAYICGEETALIESIEGKRGEPRARPPYPTTHGLWGKPTLVNNVETLANIPSHHSQWSCLVQSHRHAIQPRHEDIHHPGQRQTDGPDRSADGHHPARSHCHLRQRNEGRIKLQNGADRRFQWINHPGQLARHTHGFRLIQPGWCLARFGRAAHL
jgi:NADP-reducing hydrogenase subunit HndC